MNKYSRFLLIPFAAGCVAGPPEGATSIASRVGDRASYPLGQVVASVRMAGPENRLQNLHLYLAVAVNPRTETWQQVGDVLEIVSRLQPRLLDAIVTDLTAREPLSTADIGECRRQLAALAQSTLDAGLASWPGRRITRFVSSSHPFTSRTSAQVSRRGSWVRSAAVFEIRGEDYARQ